ncbi:hypothetical protein EJ04DRAFT_516316 [Polyplosphaeria fusca]|uniref:Uncharacterized protein n=1 Tax=Polyplosphaeria fusca TaxID=682080 RepID=A0A9P4UY76_9PLEO|nr:hypothetical protein EJ04DRAFT_516316 [Polyplosphaeria fusca]
MRKPALRGTQTGLEEEKRRKEAPSNEIIAGHAEGPRGKISTTNTDHKASRWENTSVKKCHRLTAHAKRADAAPGAPQSIPCDARRSHTRPEPNPYSPSSLQPRASCNPRPRPRVCRHHAPAQSIVQLNATRPWQG